MSSESKASDPLWPDDPPPSVRWRSWPLRDKMLTALTVVIGLIAVGLATGWVTDKAHLGLLAAAVLAVGLWRFFLPVTYELNSDGVNQRVLGRHRCIPWNRIRHYEVNSRGVLLLPFSDRCPMDAFRGLYLPWGSRRDEVLAQLRYYVGRPRNR